MIGIKKPTVVLTAGVLFVGEGGLEPPNSSEDRFTVCCNCHYATPPESHFSALFQLEPAEGFGPPTPRLQITCSTAELCRPLC